MEKKPVKPAIVFILETDMTIDRRRGGEVEINHVRSSHLDLHSNPPCVVWPEHDSLFFFFYNENIIA